MNIMARRLSTRKRPDREVKQLVERHKITGKVLDDRTLMVLHFYLSHKVFTSLDYPMAQGKESIVFRATTPTGFAAVKIYKFETTSFRHRMQYLDNDPRFRKPSGLRQAVQTWAKKEYANLKLLREEGVSVPEPIAQKDNVLVMEFLGEGGVPYAQLKDVWLEDPAKTLDDLLKGVKLMRKAGLVHADLSEYNIVMRGNQPVILDVGQSVVLKHPSAEEFFLKDVRNLLHFFKRRGVDRDEQEVLAYLKGSDRRGK